jgi:hypothetical protein
MGIPNNQPERFAVRFWAKFKRYNHGQKNIYLWPPETWMASPNYFIHQWCRHIQQPKHGKIHHIHQQTRGFIIFIIFIISCIFIPIVWICSKESNSSTKGIASPGGDRPHGGPVWKLTTAQDGAALAATDQVLQGDDPRPRRPRCRRNHSGKGIEPTSTV